MAAASNSGLKNQPTGSGSNPNDFAKDVMNKVASSVAASSPQITSIQTIIKAQQEEEEKTKKLKELNEKINIKLNELANNSINGINLDQEKKINNQIIG